MPAPRPVAHLNGRLVPLAEASISPLDRGFLYGDAVYEVIPVYGGRPFLLGEHLSRLNRSLAAIGMVATHSDHEWLALLSSLIEANGGGDLYVYLQVSRGAEWGRNHAAPTGLAPTVFAFAAELPAEGPVAGFAGVSAITAVDNRWARCDIKSVNLLGNVLAKTAAAASDATEAIYLSEGLLREGSSSAILVVRGTVVRAPRETPAILPSTSRQLVLKLAAACGLSVEVGDVRQRELRAADEVWMCNATRLLLPVIRIDGVDVGTGHPGRYWQRLRRRLDDFRREVAHLPPLTALE